MGLSHPGLGHPQPPPLAITQSQIRPGDLQAPTNPVLFGDLGFNCQLI